MLSTPSLIILKTTVYKRKKEEIVRGVQCLFQRQTRGKGRENGIIGGGKVQISWLVSTVRLKLNQELLYNLVFKWKISYKED